MPPLVLFLIWLGLAPVQLAAFLVGTGLWLDLPWVLGAALFMLLLTLPIPYLGLVVVTFVAYLGATHGWGLDWWQADLVLLPFAIVSVAVTHAAGTFDIFSWPKRRMELARSANGASAGSDESDTAITVDSEMVVERLERSWRPKPEYAPVFPDPFDDGIGSLDREYYASHVLLPLAKHGLAEAQYKVAVLYSLGEGLSVDGGEAVWWFRRAADQGHARAQFQLALLYQAGNLVEQNNDETVKWYRQAAEHGFAKAEYKLGRMYADGMGVPLDKAEAANWWQRAAEQGLADAQASLAHLLANGDGVEQDDTLALMWLELAAAQGHGHAIKARDDAAAKLPDDQVEVARKHALDRAPPAEPDGIGDDDEVVVAYRQAVAAYQRHAFKGAFNALKSLAERGHVNSQFGLGIMLANGQGTDRDDAQAALWYRRAAEQNHAKAQYGLGVRYADGRGMEQNDAEAAMWYLRAACQGDVRAQYNMGVKCATGLGVSKDPQQALGWYRLAAERGYTRAQYNLGVMLSGGGGICRNERQAVSWYRRAAEQGDAMAQNNLGVMLAHGLGAPRDPAEARTWFRRASAQGYSRAATNLTETLAAHA